MTGPASSRGPATQTARATWNTTGCGIHYEVCGKGEPTVLLLLPTWSIVSSRMWKMQVPYLARHARVVSFDGRGTGRSDSPAGPESYLVEEFAADAVAVMDTTSIDRAVLVALSCGALWASVLAAEHPERVAGIVLISPAVGLAPGHADRLLYDFSERYDNYEGWAKYNRHYWQSDYQDFLRVLLRAVLERAALDKAGRGLRAMGTRNDTRIADRRERGHPRMSLEQLIEHLSRIGCPSLVLHGDKDLIRRTPRARLWPTPSGHPWSPSKGPGISPMSGTP